MTTAVRPLTVLAPAPRRRAWRLFGLCACGVQQPILDALVRNDVFRKESAIGVLELSALVALLGLILPALAIGIDRCVVRLSTRTRGFGRETVVFALAVVTTLSLLRPAMEIRALQNLYIVWLITLPAALIAGWVVACGHERWQSLEQWLTLTAWGGLLFPAVFAARLAYPAMVSPPPGGPPTAIGRPVPVVMVVFDEFCGLSLMNGAGELDAKRFPNFARLGKSATWYSNATTVHGRTFMAMPALLSGRFPTPERSPEANLYPGNLFELIAGSHAYEMTVFEPLTRLCDQRHANPKPTNGFAERTWRLLHAVAVVYPQLLLSSDTPVDWPRAPDLWYGIHGDSGVAEDVRVGRLTYAWNRDRDRQLTHFLKCLQPVGPRPQFAFLHVALPHYPWCFSPSGRLYFDESQAPASPANAVGTAGEDWVNDPAGVARNEFRYRMQVGFVDRFLGALQDRLHEQGLWDDCLLIVAGDHGVSFRPGHSRREPDAANLPDLMSIPLFIKRPGQSIGAVDDRNVESIDVLPTLADVIELSPQENWDGNSLLGSVVRPRKSYYFDERLSVIEPTFPQKWAALQRQEAVFGSEPLERTPRAANSHPEWVGRGIAEFAPAAGLSTSQTVRLAQIAEFRDGNPPLPCLIEGSINPSEWPVSSTDAVLAVDGVIMDVCRVYRAAFDQYDFCLWLPELLANQPDRDVQVFLIANGRCQRVYDSAL